MLTMHHLYITSILLVSTVYGGLRLVLFVEDTLLSIGVWGRGAQTGNSLKRGVCVCERVARVMERWRMLAGQIRGSDYTAPVPAPADRILDWVLSRFCLGPTSPKLPITQRVALSVSQIRYKESHWL